MIEIELMDDACEPREFSETMREFRRRVVMQEKGNLTLTVKSHLDDMVHLICLAMGNFVTKQIF